jgi:hypothetical protein
MTDGIKRGPARDKDDIAGNSEVMADATEKIRALADTRAATVAATKASKNDAYAVHLIPVEGENAEAAWSAAEWLSKARADEAKIVEDRALEDEKAYQYFLKCRNAVHTVGALPAPPHGIYFTKRPDGIVGDRDWFSTYKKRDAAWRGQEILCQVCLKMGIEGARLHYEWQDQNRGLFIPEKRWIWKLPKDLARYKVEGMTRAFDLPSESSNRWRAEVDAKLDKARQEGVLTNG